MKLNILFFGSLTDITGHSQKDLEVESLNTVRSLNEYLQKLYPSLIKYKYKIAVNQKIAEQDHALNAGDEVAFLPPFAGG